MSAYTILVQNKSFKGYVKLYQKGQQGTDGDEKYSQKVNSASGRYASYAVIIMDSISLLLCC